MTRHIDAVVLARFRDDDLSQRRAARIGAHLAGCTRCADLSAELASVTTLLASAQAPGIPDHLTARITSALATEAARRAAPDRGTEPGRRELPVRSRAPRWRPRRPGLTSPAALRALAAAGVIAVIAGGGYELIGSLSSGGSGGSGGSGSAASSASSGSAGSNAAGRPAPRAAAPMAGPNLGAPGAGPYLRYGRAGHQDSFMPVSTATNFGPASLGAQASAALSQFTANRAALARPSPSGPRNPDHGPAQPGPAAHRFAGIPVPMLEACVTRIAAGDSVLLVDLARYRGRQATVIVTAAAGSAARQVWVVGTACSESRSDVLAHQPMPGG